MRHPKRVLAASTLIAEALVVFFATLAATALHREEQGSYLIAGGVLALLCVLCAGLLRSRAGYALGWGLQVVIVASGFVVPEAFRWTMVVIGLAFAGIWFGCLRVGTRVERERDQVARGLAQRQGPGSG
ncbi:DUF4233 domain-containing protein [Kineococcus sp. SYSU DK005]|uniref:DUF4233 domain-containing protein n=1 Tax=Kineococcus sp. SYSU DK005 TaxID=3383126 RepID=UPI003D7CB8AB